MLASLASVPVLDCFRDHLGCFQHLNLFLGRVTKGRRCRIWRGGPLKTFISYIAVIIVCVTRRGLCDGGGAVGETWVSQEPSVTHGEEPWEGPDGKKGEFLLWVSTRGQQLATPFSGLMALGPSAAPPTPGSAYRVPSCPGPLSSPQLSSLEEIHTCQSSDFL